MPLICINSQQRLRQGHCWDINKWDWTMLFGKCYRLISIFIPNSGHSLAELPGIKWSHELYVVNLIIWVGNTCASWERQLQKLGQNILIFVERHEAFLNLYAGRQALNPTIRLFQSRFRQIWILIKWNRLSGYYSYTLNRRNKPIFWSCLYVRYLYHTGSKTSAP